jgi:hypothetical protein
MPHKPSFRLWLSYQFDSFMSRGTLALIGGLAVDLHRRNLRALYRQIYGKLPLASSDEDFEEYEEVDEEE